jgi:OOP family OmpA-OmpF porin
MAEEPRRSADAVRGKKDETMTNICNQCGASLADHEAFCTKCGTPRDETAALTAAQPFCTKCGALLAAELKFCTKCGAPVGAAASAPVATGNIRPADAASRAVAVAAAPAAAAGAPASKGPLLRIIAVIVGVVLLLALAGAGGVAYLGYRATRKVARMERESARNPNAAVAKVKGLLSAASAGKPSAGTPAGTTPTAVSSGKLSFAIPDFVPVTGSESERTVGGTEADLVVRTGDINNLGFGFPKGYDPFSGESTPPHPYPWAAPPSSPDGTDRIMIGSVVTTWYLYDKPIGPSDGYSGVLAPCPRLSTPIQPPCRERQETMPRPITLNVGALPAKIDAVLFQIFVDDFQAPVFHSHFQVSLNGTRIPSFEDAINALDQTGPIGKLITLKLLPEYWPLLQSGTVKLFIDDPTTHAGDGYAIDFVRILVNPHNFKYHVTVAVTVTDADKHAPVPGATVTAALVSATTDRQGHCTLADLPAGLVIATAIAPGYDGNSVQVDLPAGHSGKAVIPLHKHDEGTAALERAVAQTGTATVYGIHFDTDSAKLRSDSAPALAAVLGLINNRPGSHWVISGHTDNQGSVEHNQKLSEARAGSVIAWLKAHGVTEDRLAPQGFGASRPVADNGTAVGRALNRRVEVALGAATKP